MVGALSLVLTGSAACDALPDAVVFGNPSVDCGAFDGPDCNDLLEIGLDAIAAGRPEQPLAIAVDNACPSDARCVPSDLGGMNAAVAVRWPDGRIQWAQIPLPADWPASPPGEPAVMTGAPPAHVLSLVGPAAS
jgi:hypothetical protein